MSESKLFKKMSKASDKWGESNDCTVKAVAIATGVNYETAHGKCALRGRSYRKGLSAVSYTHLTLPTIYSV